MTYISQLGPNELLIADKDEITHEDLRRQHKCSIFSAEAAVNFTGNSGVELGKGYERRDFAKYPQGYLPFAAPFGIPIIPRSEWDDRIREMEESQTRLSDVIRFHNVPTLNQQQTNYCWANGVVSAMHAVRAKAGYPFVSLSPASVAALVKNFRNEGGWGSQALKKIVEDGICPSSLWPANTWNDRSLDNETSRRERQHYKILEWWDLQPLNFDQLMTCVLYRLPCPVGYDWWSHEVCAIDPVKVSANLYGIRIWNSWGDSYGDRGMAVLSQSKATPNEALCPLVASMI